MTKRDAFDVPAPSLPTVQAFEVKLRSVWDLPLPGERSAADLNDLEQVIAEHEKWVASLVTPGMPLEGCRAVLKNQDLRGANFAHRDLRGADFSGANLEGASLEGCLLTLASLKGANLRNADLRGAKIKRADLTDATIEGILLSPGDR